MDERQLQELARYYEEYLHGDPRLASTKQARLIFESEAHKLYAAQSDEYRAKASFENFREHELVPRVDTFLSRRQSTFPTITPERPTSPDR